MAVDLKDVQHCARSAYSKYIEESIAVIQEKTGKGIGRCLTEYGERAARKAGMNAVELYTNEAMTENLEMYPKLGYVETERKRQAGFNRVFFRKEV